MNTPQNSHKNNNSECRYIFSHIENGVKFTHYETDEPVNANVAAELEEILANILFRMWLERRKPKKAEFPHSQLRHESIHDQKG